MDPLGKQAGKLSGTILDGGRTTVQLWRLSAVNLPSIVLLIIIAY